MEAEDLCLVRIKKVRITVGLWEWAKDSAGPAGDSVALPPVRVSVRVSVVTASLAQRELARVCTGMVVGAWNLFLFGPQTC